MNPPSTRMLGKTECRARDISSMLLLRSRLAGSGSGRCSGGNERTTEENGEREFSGRFSRGKHTARERYR